MNIKDLVQNQAKCDELLNAIDDIVSDLEFGLPMFDEGKKAQMREAIYKWASQPEFVTPSPMRWVMVSEHVKQEDGRWKLEEKGVAKFHSFGMNYEEFESGAGNFSTAIVEWPDGRIDNVPVEHISFINPTPTTTEKTI